MNFGGVGLKRLKIALTKGRLEKKTVELLENCGYDCTDLRDAGRKLILPVRNAGFDVVLAKAPDVITYVEHGAVEMGVVGKDTILEQGMSFFEMLDLGFGNCRFALATRLDEPFFDTYRRKRVATKYPNVAKQYFNKRGMDVEIIRIEGSVELSPLLGLADGIVDIVETGDTLRANGLVPIADIAPVSARFIVNIAAMKMYKKEISELLEKLKIYTQG
jgi:ATP phosphoribosyltransferase